ncbi:YiiX/YebB-like N1pC/P60 family cysteine hydrolase [Endozoicomonas sp. YOMI1]|uniref:YiiX/YebB-like N1pC/P60 family cysteine hydrolase n=1 Tax=Endozoicomonas sp. YOMI1 TaxID=2828739 RepID=UPI0021497F6D|nr:YiiX/YebB-like N1pC/P60 family cysteine hydrolase [Endozoicomonas sp. YOMI1]
MIKPYSSMRNELKTGDVVLFSGKGAFSDIIKYGTLSKWSHVGMILNIPEYDFLTVWESTTLNNIKDLESGVPRKGVQLVPLSNRVQKYSGDISVRQLKGCDLPENSLRMLMELRKELRGKEYEKSKIELFKSAYDGPFGHNKEDLSSIFCSELVAEAYQRLGLVTEEKPSNEYTPADFSEKRMKKLLGDYYLGEEIVLKDE